MSLLKPTPLPSVINLTDLAIKRIIKMAKQISAFSRVCQEDQVLFSCPNSSTLCTNLWFTGQSF